MIGPKIHLVPDAAGARYTLCGRRPPAIGFRVKTRGDFNALDPDMRCGLCDRILNGAQPRRPAPLDPATAAELLALIAGLEFLFARTMPDQPHEYVRRTVANTADFFRLVNAIRKYGVDEDYRGTRYRYLRPGDGRRYWLMSGRPVLINRAVIR